MYQEAEDKGSRSGMRPVTSPGAPELKLVSVQEMPSLPRVLVGLVLYMLGPPWREPHRLFRTRYVLGSVLYVRVHFIFCRQAFKVSILISSPIPFCRTSFSEL